MVANTLGNPLSRVQSESQASGVENFHSVGLIVSGPETKDRPAILVF
jgi:hypothetical protein